MSSEDVQARRERHRAEFAEGTSWFLDIVLLGDGNGNGNGNGEGGDTKQLIGSTGFRSFAAGEAEWGAIVHRDFQRTGVCTEAYTACVSMADTGKWALVKFVTAVTKADNTRIIEFCSNMGMEESEDAPPPPEGSDQPLTKFILPVNDE